MNRLMGVWLLAVVIAVSGCSRTLTREHSSAGALEDASELEACAGVCRVQLAACADDHPGTEAQCAAENSRCVQSCAPAENAQVYAFYCQAESYTRRGLVLSDGSCVGATGGTLDAQRSGCEQEFAPPAEAFAYTVNCTPVLSWVGAGGEGVRRALPARSGP